VNPYTDHRPTDQQALTKESERMTSLRHRFIHLVSSMSPFAAAGGDCGAPSADTGSVEPSNGRTQRARVASLLARPRTLRCAAFAAAVLVLGAVEASPAAAAQPWFHLTSSSRPTAIEPGTAEDAVQELVIAATGGTFDLDRTSNEAIYTGPPTPLLPFNVTAAALQSALQGLYGTGNVTVTGGPGDATGAHPYLISFTGALADQPVESVGVFSHLTRSGGSPSATLTQIAPGRADGELVLTAINLGTSAAGGQTNPIRIVDTLPPGLGVSGAAAMAGDVNKPQRSKPFPCSSAGSVVTCTLEAALAPYDKVDVRIDVHAEPGFTAGEENQVSISGGGAPPAQFSRPLPIGEQPGFGLQQNELSPEGPGGGVATAAGSHPFQVTSTLVLNQEADPAALLANAFVNPTALPKDVRVGLPPGLVGNPRPLPQCSLSAFLTYRESEEAGYDDCPAQAAIGVASLDVSEPGTIHGLTTFTLPVFNLEPALGEPARFGIFIPIVHEPILLDTALRDGPGEDYGVTVSSLNTTQSVGFLASSITLWGSPGDPRHDNSRSWACLYGARDVKSSLICNPLGQVNPPAFETLPTSCSNPLSAGATIDSWLQPDPELTLPTTVALPALDACNQLLFKPTIAAQPTTDAATSSTGLNFELDFNDEGLLNSADGARAQSETKKVVVTLPQGFTANPSLAEGLKACSEAEYDAATDQVATGCNEESKIGSVEVESPLVTPKLTGSLYVAKQGENPYHNLLTIYLIARNPELGIVVRQALKVTPDPVTGQLTTEVDNVPQLPFSHFQLSFRQGARSPLISPPTCGTYGVKADLFPYSEPAVGVERESSFQITQGPEGLGCPSGGIPPFHPGLEAGTINNAAGTYSPFFTHITRRDSEQEITRFSIKLPTGLLAKLAGVSECSDADIAAAKAREHEGGATEEEAHPSCPASSEVGHSLVGTGVGNVLAYAGGKFYLAGPYHGSPISLVSINDAKVGPFDLGTVVVRFALDVNHETAEVSVDGANSDPIPHIVDGIPIHLRDIRAYVDRPGFTLNPTSCAKKSTAATILGSGLNFASSSDDVPVTVSSPFQAADCASLGFAPKLALNLVGKKTHRGALPAFKAVLTYPKYGAYANIAKAQVTLPGSEFLEQGHLKNVCTRKVFETGTNPGENCPANSIYGKARATTPLLEAPLEGPVYLRTGYGTKLPELAAALNGPQISITLAGTIDSVHQKGTEGSRIRNTFALVPDAPVEKFTLELKGGKKGLLVNSTDVCKGAHKALAAFTGQNGKLDEYEPALTAQCGKGKKKSGKKSGAKKKDKGAKGNGGK
jgi:hypothetical protein